MASTSPGIIVAGPDIDIHILVAFQSWPKFLDECDKNSVADGKAVWYEDVLEVFNSGSTTNQTIAAIADKSNISLGRAAEIFMTLTEVVLEVLNKTGLNICFYVRHTRLDEYNSEANDVGFYAANWYQLTPAAKILLAVMEKPKP